MDEIRLSGLIAPVFREAHGWIRDQALDELWLKGGRGSAKSSFASIELVLTLLRDPNAHAVVFRKVGATLRESVYEQVLWAIDRLGASECFVPRLSPLEITRTDTGQKILFRGTDDPSKSKSLKLAKGYFRCLWFEELAEFGGLSELMTVKASVLRGAPKGVRCLTICSYNPPMQAGHWVNAEALLPREGRRVHASRYTDIPREWLGESFFAGAEALRSANERLYRHMYLGEVTGNGGQVFENVAIEPIDAGRFDVFRCGLDFGFAADPDALVKVAYDRRERKLYIVDEFVGVRTPTETLAERVKSVCGGSVVRCDSADPRMIREMRLRGVNAMPAKKGPGSVEHGVRRLQELAAIVIDPARCPNAAREFTAYAYASDGLGGFCSELPDRDNHTIDAVRYAMEELFSARIAVSS